MVTCLLGKQKVKGPPGSNVFVLHVEIEAPYLRRHIADHIH